MIRTACIAVLAASTLLATQNANATTNLNGRISQIVNGLHQDAYLSPGNFSFTINHGSSSIRLFTGIAGMRALNGYDYALLNDWLGQPAPSNVFNGAPYKFTHSVLGSFFDNDQEDSSDPANSVFDGSPYKFTYSVLDSYFDNPSASARMMMVEPPLEPLSIQSGAVPEPASWAMMIGGFALAGAVLRRRSAVTFA